MFSCFLQLIQHSVYYIYIYASKYIFFMYYKKTLSKRSRSRRFLEMCASALPLPTALVRTIRNFTQKFMTAGASIYVPINHYMGCVPNFLEKLLLSPLIFVHNKWLDFVPINHCMGCVPNFLEKLLLSPSIFVHNKWLYGL
jgi:hypothetical protein